VTVDDFQACSEVCQAHGFVRQAEFFRGFSEDRCVVYVVVECREGFRLNFAKDPYIVGEEGSDQGGDPVLIFLDRGEAIREAERLNVEAFRERDLLEHCYFPVLGRLYIDEITDLTADELYRSISEILGQEFRFPEGHIAPPIFPPSATDDQMTRIMALFTRRFFYVAETELVI
jgi:hypothetical protein